MEHFFFQYIYSKCRSRHELCTACGLSCLVSWFAGETSVALEDRVLLQPFTRKRLLAQNRQSDKNTLHATLQTKARSQHLLTKNQTFIDHTGPATDPSMATHHLIYSECHWVLDLVNPAEEQDSRDWVPVNPGTDPTNRTVQIRIQIQSRFCGAAPGGETLWRHDPQTWHTGCVAGFTRSRSRGSGSGSDQSNARTRIQSSQVRPIECALSVQCCLVVCSSVYEWSYYLLLRQSVCLSFCLSVCPSASVFLSILMFLCLSVCPSPHPLIYISLCPSASVSCRNSMSCVHCPVTISDGRTFSIADNFRHAMLHTLLWRWEEHCNPV